MILVQKTPSLGPAFGNELEKPPSGIFIVHPGEEWPSSENSNFYRAIPVAPRIDAIDLNQNR